MIHCDIHMTLDSGSEFSLNARFSAPDRSLVLFGPSGSGKSLTLLALAGICKPDNGRIEMNGRTLFNKEAEIDLRPKQRRVGLMFQDYALFPHLTLRDNVSFGLAGWNGRVSPAKGKRVDALLELFGLIKVADQYPHELSGGQKQRTALARALAPSPEVLLLDEPFSALDQPLRQRLRYEVRSILERFDIPLILVTHDLGDVEAFAGTVVVYDRGRVVCQREAKDPILGGRTMGQWLADEVVPNF